MQIGLFFGSFNPVHIGHMAIANYMLTFTDLEEVWLVVSPHNPLKQKSSLLDQHQRLALVAMAADDHPKIRANNIEFQLPQPSYTIHTLAHLQEKYPQHTFSLIMGQDNLGSLHKWKNYEEILKLCRIYIYPRPGCGPTVFDEHPRVFFTAAPLMDISSTFIRKALQEKKDIRYFLPQRVWEEIDLMNYYR
jgi:nicotinate-nucleotide adenylyltransferase